MTGPERYFILGLLIVGLLCTGLSYFNKTRSGSAVQTIQIREPRTVININTENAHNLERLPGIGPVLAQEIIAYRQRQGGFKNIEELKNIKGIGDKKFEEIKDLVSVNE